MDRFFMGFFKFFVGGLFGYEEFIIENVFKYVVYWINYEKNLLGGVIFNYDICCLLVEDVFILFMDSKYNI